jgi:hypothetical protein
VVDAELHGLAFHDSAHAQDRDVEIAVGEVDAALAQANLFEAEGGFIKLRGFLDVVSSNRDMFDSSHDSLQTNYPKAGREFFEVFAAIAKTISSFIT